MSIARAIERAYRVSQERGWPRIYWALDLHGTCLASNYTTGQPEWLTPMCESALRELSEMPETHFIIWSSLHESDKVKVTEFFNEAGIKIFGINANPMEKSTETGNFEEKWYFSILVDDKAGFDPSEWLTVLMAVHECRKRYPLPADSKPQKPLGLPNRG